MKYVLGIDLGTQSVKAGLTRLGDVRLVLTASRDYPGGSLQDAELLWSKTTEAARELTDALEAGDSVEGIGLSGQMHGTVLYDASDRLIGPIINWQDERGNVPDDAFGGLPAVEKMAALIASDDFADLGIDVVASGFLGVTLFHIKETQPELFARVARALPPTDYLRRRLLGGGEWATDPTNAFGTGLFNVREGCWHERAIRRLGLPVSIFPAVRPTEAVAGALSGSAAAELGLPAGVPVVYGGGDNQMSMIGSGAFAPDSPILLNLGTSSQFCAVIDEYRKIDGLDTRSFPRGRFALVGAGLTGGAAYTWMRNTLADDVRALGLGAEISGEDFYARLDALAEKASPGCDGLRFVPYLRGARRAPDLRAAFHGVSTSNFTIGNRARAVMEGVMEELHDFYKISGVAAESVIGAGNGFVRSKPWRRVASLRFGLPIKVTDVESAVYGATLVAAEGLNLATLGDSL